jgi:SulP family sulfate permease
MKLKDYARSLKPDPKNLKSDVVSGFATGLFSIPEGMAYAQLAGVNPVYGLYSGIAATIVSSLTTGTILMISTLTSAIALSTASVMNVAGIQDSQMPQALFTITFLVGAIMFAMGLLRLGMVVNFVSNAVMTGFVAAASLLIIIGEMGDFSGYAPSGANKFMEMINWFANIGQWDPTTTAVAVATVILMLVLKLIKQTEKLAAIITLIVMSLIVNLLGLSSVALVQSIATIPNSLPAPMLPDFSLVPKLALGSLSVALVALIQGAGISTAYPNPYGNRASQNRDFTGEGLGNLVGGFFQSMATGGSLSRTGISVGAGASSRWGGIFAGLWLALIVLLLGSLAELVPLSVIAGMLFVIGAELILGRLPDVRLIYRTSWGSVAAGLLTFLSALFIPLQWTIFLGAGLSLILYVYAASKHVQVHCLVRNENGRYEEHDVPDTYPSHAVTIISVGGHEFFAEIPLLDEHMPSTRGVTHAAVILRAEGLEQASSTGLKWLQRYTKELQAGGNLVLLARIRPHLKDQLERTGLMDIVGRKNVFEAQPGFGASLDAALEAAQAWLSMQQSTAESSPPAVSAKE